MTIHHREDGLVELGPPAPLDRSERQLALFTVLLVIAGLFVADVLPAPAFVAIAGVCLAAEACLGVRALALVLLRPLADVHEVSRWRAGR